MNAIDASVVFRINVSDIGIFEAKLIVILICIC